MINIVNPNVFLRFFIGTSFFLRIFATYFKYRVMKRIALTIACCFCILSMSAQVDKKYGIGAVPVVNGRVTFERDVNGLNADSQEVFAKAMKWVEKRFVKPTVLKAKIVETDNEAGRIIVNAEEYITFRDKFFVLDRSRINYWLEISAKDNGYTMKMTRISYWYEEERDGGQKFSAEEWITDEECFNEKQTRLLRSTGKFRVKTIDLIDNLSSELKDRF